MTGKRSQAGYSLVEALIAVAILAGIAGALAPVTYTAIQAASRINSLAADAETSRVGGNALTGIFAAFINAETDESAAAFIGEPNKIKFNILADQQTGPRKVELRIVDEKLLLTPPINVAEKRIGANTTEVAIADNALNFRYFGAIALDADPSWHSRWTEKTPPLLIELSFSEGNEEAAKSQSFVLTNRAPLHCAFDQVSRQCRN